MLRLRKKIVASFIVILFLVSSLPFFTFNASAASVPTVTTNTITGQGITNATLQGTLLDDGASRVLYERDNGAGSGTVSIWGVNWISEAFKVGTTSTNVNHYTTGVRLLLARSGSPGTVTVSIRATTGGYPTGTDIVSGTTDGNTLTTNGAGEWRFINFTSNAFLSASTQYAIIVRAPSGTGGNYLRWVNDYPTSYLGGHEWDSGDSGVTWGDAGSTYGLIFEEYGLTVSVGSTVGFDYGRNTSYGTEVYSLPTYVYAAGGTTNTVQQYLEATMAYKTQTASYGGNIFSVIEDGTCIYAGGASNQTIKQYWKSDMTLRKFSASYGGTINSLAQDDTFVYAGGVTNQSVKQYWKSNMTLKAFTANLGSTIYGVLADGTYVYVTVGNYVRQYWSSNMTYRKTTPTFGNIIYAITQDATYIYAGGSGTGLIRKYLKSDMSYVTGTILNNGEIPLALTNDATYVYDGGNSGTGVYKYWKSNLSYIGKTASYGGAINAVTQDDIYVYCGGGSNTVRQYWKSNLTLKATSPSYGGTIQALSTSNVYISGNTFSFNVLGLQSNTTYHYRAFANNSAGIGTGADKNFTTKYDYPLITTNPATGVKNRNTTLNGTLTNNKGLPCNIDFQYGPTTAYGTNVGAFTKLTDPASLTTGGSAYGVSFSNDTTYLAYGLTTTPFIAIYKRSGDTFTKLSNPASLPSGNVYDVAWSTNGTYLALAVQTSPYITIYQRSGDTFTKLSNPATLPTGAAYGVSFSTDGTYLTVAHTTSPYITIYKYGSVNHTYYKLANPASLPASTGYDCAWSADGTYLAVGHVNNPYVTIYSRSGDVFTKVTNPTTLPTGNGRGVGFSQDGTYLAVAHETSPYVSIYKISAGVFTKLTNPLTLPPTTSYGVAWSNDGKYLSLSSGSTPFIINYVRNGDVFIQLSNPDTVPTGYGWVDWSNDGTYLTQTSSVTPYVQVYKPVSTKTTGQSVSINAYGFTPATLYHFRARAINTEFTAGYGLDSTFTTLPDAPSSLAITSGSSVDYSSGYYITWSHGTGYSYSVVRYSTTSYPATPTDGTLLYNGSNAYFFHNSLATGTTYYYSIWEWSNVAGSGYSPTPAQISKEYVGVGIPNCDTKDKMVFNPASTNTNDVANFNSTYFIVAYIDAGNSNYPTVRVGMRSGTSVIWKTSETVVQSYAGSGSYQQIAALNSTDFVVILCNSSGGYPWVRAGRFTGSAISWLTPRANVYAGQIVYPAVTGFNSTDFAVSYEPYASPWQTWVRTGRVTGATITWTTAAQGLGSNCEFASLCALSSTRLVIAYKSDEQLSLGTGCARICTYTGSVLTVGARYIFQGSAIGRYVNSEEVRVFNSTDFIIIYQSNTNTGGSYYGASVVGRSPSGTTISWLSSPTIFHSQDTYYTRAVSVFPGTTYCLVVYRDGQSGLGGRLTNMLLHYNTTTAVVSNTGEYIWQTTSTSPYLTADAFDSNYYVLSYTDETNSSYGTTLIGRWNAPAILNPSPATAAIKLLVSPMCSVKVDDANADTMIISFAENTTGSWVIRQTKTGIVSGVTSYWNYTQASKINKKYWWRVYANDGTYNVSLTFSLSTVDLDLTHMINPTVYPSNYGDGIAWSPDGTYLAEAYGPTSPYAIIYKKSGDMLSQIASPSGIADVAYGAAWSSDGNYLAIGNQASPYINIYKRSYDTFTRLNNPVSLPGQAVQSVSWYGNTYLALGCRGNTVCVYKRTAYDEFIKLSIPTQPTGDVYGCAFSSDGTYLAISYLASPYVMIYKRDGDTFTKLADPTGGFPAGTAYGVSWSTDTTYLAFAHNGAPYVTIYKRNGDAFAKLPNPASLPSTNCRSVCFSYDGTYLSLGLTSTPYITTYKRSGDTFTIQSNPSVLPAGNVYGISWSTDGTYTALAVYSYPYIMLYKRSADVFTAILNPLSIPQSAVPYGIAWSNSTTYLAIADNNNPYVHIYKKTGDTLTKLPNPGTIPTGTGWSVAWGYNDRYLEVVHSTSPYVTIYNRTGDTFTKLPNPATLPPQAGRGGASFSPDGTYMTVGMTASPWLCIYKRGATNWTYYKLPNPGTLPTGQAYGCAWSTNGTYLAVAHATSPYITMYKRAGDVFTWLGALPNGPSQAQMSVGWSSDGNYVTFGGQITPYVWTYKRTGDTFTKLTTPAPAGSNAVYGVSWMNSTYFAIAASNQPELYKRTGDTLTRLNLNDNKIYGSGGYLYGGCSWATGGKYLAVANSYAPFFTVYNVTYPQILIPKINLTSPQNNSLLDRKTYANLIANISGFDIPINVKFYNASNNALLYQYTAVGLGTYSYNWTNLPAGIKRYWYVIVNGTTANLKSSTWNFIPDNEPRVKNFRIETINDKNITVSWDNEPDMAWISLKIGSTFMEVRKILGFAQSWFVSNLFENSQYNLQWQLGDNKTAMSDYNDFNFRTHGWKPDITNFTYRKLIVINHTAVGSDKDGYSFNLTLTDSNFRYSSGPNWWNPTYPAFLHLNLTSHNDIRFANYYNMKFLPWNITYWNVPGAGGISTQVLPNESYWTGAFINGSWAHDNDWYSHTTPVPYGVLYYNYTIPTGAKTTSKFRSYQGDWIYDVTLPTGCYGGSKLRFKSICDYDVPYIGTYCWNYSSSNWVLIGNTTARYFYETQMGWEFSATVRIKVTPEHFNDATATNTPGIDGDYDTKFWMYYGNPTTITNNQSTITNPVYTSAFTSQVDEEEFELTPPIISNIVESNKTATSINITWVTDQIADGRIKYATNPWFFGSHWTYRLLNQSEEFDHLYGNGSNLVKLLVYSPQYISTISVVCSNPAYNSKYSVNSSTGEHPVEVTFKKCNTSSYLNWTITYRYNKTIDRDTYTPQFMLNTLPTNTVYYYQLLAHSLGGNTTSDGTFTIGTPPPQATAKIQNYDENRPAHQVTVWGNLTNMNGLPYVHCSIQYWNESSTDFSETSMTNMTSTGLFNKTISVSYGHMYYYRVKAGDGTGYSDVYSNEFMPIQEFFAGDYVEDNNDNGKNTDFRERQYLPPYPNGTVNLTAKAYEQTGYWEGSLQTENWMWVETNITTKGTLTLHLYTKQYGHVGDYVLTNDTDSSMRYIKLTNLNSSWYTFYITGTGGQMVLNWTKPSLIHRAHESRVDESKYVSFNAVPSPVSYTLLYMDTQATNISAYEWAQASRLDLYSAMGVEYFGGGYETGVLPKNSGTPYDRGQLFRGGVWNGEPNDTGTLEPTMNNKPMGASRFCFAFTSYDWNLSQLPSNNITNYYYRYWETNSHWSTYLGYYQDRLFDYNYLMQFKYDTISYTRDWKPITNTTIYTERKVDNVSGDVFNTGAINQSLQVGYKNGFNFDPSYDNIWNFGFYTDGRWTNQQIGAHQQGFVIFNLPDNATLQGMDSDGDGVNDYNELFVYYTNPKSANTDGDNFTDGAEIAAGTDPNNYKDEPQSPIITITQPTLNQYFFHASNVTLLTTITSDYAVHYNISIWKNSGPFVHLVKSGLTPVGGDTITTFWNSTGALPTEYYVEVNATDPYNPTVHSTKAFYITGITVSNANPLNEATSQPLNLNWTVQITEAQGHTFNWTISCNNSQISSGNNEGNGTKKLTLTNLNRNTTYIITVTVNSLLYKYYSFTTASEPDYMQVSISPNATNFGAVTIGSSAKTTGYTFNMTNSGMSSDISIKFNNSENWTASLFSGIGHNKFAMNFSKDNWATETNIAPISGTLLAGLPYNDHVLFDLKIITPTTSSTLSTQHYTITFIVTPS